MTKLSQVCTACTASSRGWGPYLEASIDRARVETRPAFVAHGAKMTKLRTHTHGRRLNKLPVGTFSGKFMSPTPASPGRIRRGLEILIKIN